MEYLFKTDSWILAIMKVFIAFYLPFSHHPSLTSMVALKTNILTITLKARNLACTSEDRMAFSSVQFSHSVVSDSLKPHECQHTRPPCPSSTPRVHSDSRSSSQWCHPAISFSVVPFSSCPQSLPASESFPMSQFFAWWVLNLKK